MSSHRAPSTTIASRVPKPSQSARWHVRCDDSTRHMTTPAPGQRRIRGPKKAFGRYEKPAMLAAAVLCAVAVLVTASGGRGGSDRPLIGDEPSELASVDTPGSSDRRIDPDSVDAIASTPYQGLNVNAVRAETVKHEAETEPGPVEFNPLVDDTNGPGDVFQSAAKR